MIPPARVLAAVDFSEGSRTALAFAARLARHGGAELHVLHAQDPLLAAAARMQGVDLEAESREELRSFVSGTWPAYELSPRYHVAGGGPPIDTILTVAHREHADVIVLGAGGFSGTERVVFGSTTEGVLRNADLSVVVVPHGWAPAEPARADLAGTGPVICGVDLTLPAIEAATAAARLATLLHTDARLVHIVPRVRSMPRWRAHAEAATQESLANARRDLDRVAAQAGAVGRVQLQVETGDVPRCLAEATHASPHALLVLGRGLRTGGYAPPGSNAYRTLAFARVPVMMHVARS